MAVSDKSARLDTSAAPPTCVTCRYGFVLRSDTRTIHCRRAWLHAQRTLSRFMS